MAKFDFHCTITINASKETLFPYLGDLSAEREKWDPWLFRDPKCETKSSEKSSGIGAWMEWSSPIVGAGRLENSSEVPNEELIQNLNFIKPFKARYISYWKLKESGEGTDVTWGMKGSMPFFMRPFMKMMEMSIKADYKLGLLRLAQLVDPTADKVDISFDGKESFNKTPYIGIPFLCKTDEMESVMKTSLEKMAEFTKKSSLNIKSTFTIYEKIYYSKEMFKGVVAVEVDGVKSIDEGMVKGAIRGQNYYTTTATGSYNHMDVYWSLAYSMPRCLGLKIDKHTASFEEYIVSPANESDPQNFVTKIRIPLL